MKLTPAEAFRRRVIRKPARNEFCLQRGIVDWCRGLGKGIVQGRYFASANGGSLRGGAIAWRRLRDTGAQAGVPDLTLFREDGRHLYLEIKNGSSGRLTAAQLEWLGKLHANRIDAQCVRTLAQAVKAIMTFYEGTHEPVLTNK